MKPWMELLDSICLLEKLSEVGCPQTPPEPPASTPKTITAWTPAVLASVGTLNRPVKRIRRVPQNKKA